MAGNCHKEQTCAKDDLRSRYRSRRDASHQQLYITQGGRPTGNACLGQNNDSLVEYIGNHCQAGDTIATKHPAYFCDFDHAVAFNTFNSAMCIYTGKQARERVPAATSASVKDQNPKTGS